MKKLLFTILAFNAIHVAAQAPKEVYSRVEEKIGNLPYYSYGKGLGMTSPDSLYQLNIRFRLQSRATFQSNNDDEQSIDAQVRRLRLRFDGYIGHPKISYAIQLNFSNSDLQGPIVAGQNFMLIRDAVVYYNPNKHWSIGFGQTKLPGNRQRVNSSGALQLSDRSINNAMFNLDRDFGLQLNHFNMNPYQFSYAVKTAISQGEGRNFTKNDDTHLAYTAKVELFPFGPFKKSGEYFEGDIARESKPKLMISGVFHYNDQAKRAQGQQGAMLYEKKNINSWFADLIFKYKGFAFMTAYMNRSVNNPIAYNPENPTQFNYAMAGQGLDIQSSYVFKNNYEIVGRYSWQKMHADLQSMLPTKKEWTIGLSKYMWEHNFKLQAEASYCQDDFINQNMKDNWYVRFHMEIGI